MATLLVGIFGTVLEVDGGEFGRAAGYLLASVVGGVAAATLGYALGRRLA